MIGSIKIHQTFRVLDHFGTSDPLMRVMLFFVVAVFRVYIKPAHLKVPQRQNTGDMPEETHFQTTEIVDIFKGVRKLFSTTVH